MCPHGLVDLNDSSPQETAPPMYAFEKYLLSRRVLDEGVRAGNKIDTVPAVRFFHLILYGLCSATLFSPCKLLF